MASPPCSSFRRTPESSSDCGQSSPNMHRLCVRENRPLMPLDSGVRRNDEREGVMAGTELRRRAKDKGGLRRPSLAILR